MAPLVFGGPEHHHTEINYHRLLFAPPIYSFWDYVPRCAHDRVGLHLFPPPPPTGDTKVQNLSTLPP